MLDTETEHFLRIILLLYQATSYILKCVIKRELKKLGVSLDKLLKKEEFVDKLKHKQHFGLLQLEKLYPSSGKLDIETWDIQMLAVVITMVFRSSISADEKDNVYMIKFVHNNVTHKATASFMEEEYEDVREDLVEAIRGLASGLDLSIQKECEKLISSCCSGPLDVHVPQAIQKLEECSDELHQTFDALKKMIKVDDIKIKESADKMKQTNEETDHRICVDIENRESLVPESNKKSLQELFNDGLNNHTDPQTVCRSKLGRKTEGKEVTGIDDEDAEKWLLVEEGEELKEHIAKYGLKNIKDVLMKNLNGWKEKPLNIAVTGMSGKGKSSLINALRNMEEGDRGAAKVREEECTTKCRSYPHPEHNNFVFWDVPGVGTPTFPKATYLDQIMVDRFDFFLIVSSERFSEIDFWLTNEIRKRNKRFCFIRTKIDQDMANIQRRMKEKFQEKKEFESLKMTIKEKLSKEFGSSQFHFFMISNHYPNKYDFPFLLHQLLIDVPNEKKLAMVFGIAGMSKNIIEEKASALGSRIWKCALLSGAVAALPIPFVSSTFDIAIILEEVLFYRNQFALDDDSLRHLANIANISLKELKEKVKFKTPEDIFTAGGLTKYMTGVAAGEVAEKVAQYTIPVLGIAIACGISFASTMTVLQAILEMMKQDAIDVLVYVSTQETAVYKYLACV